MGRSLRLDCLGPLSGILGLHRRWGLADLSWIGSPRPEVRKGNILTYLEQTASTLHLFAGKASAYYKSMRHAWLLLASMCALDARCEEAPTSEGSSHYPMNRPGLYRLQPRGSNADFSAHNDADRQCLRVMKEITEEELSAPTLAASRISALPARVEESSERAVEQAERNLLRERVRTADRLFKEGRADEAIQMMQATEQTLKSPSLRAFALNRLATYAFRLKRLKEAAESARRAWEINPKDVDSANNLAAILLYEGKSDEALKILLSVYGRALDRADWSYVVHFNLACAYSLKGDTNRALQNLLLAPKADPRATYSVLGDPHLDAIRDHPDFIRIRDSLVQFFEGNGPR